MDSDRGVQVPPTNVALVQQKGQVGVQANDCAGR